MKKSAPKEKSFESLREDLIADITKNCRIKNIYDLGLNDFKELVYRRGLKLDSKKVIDYYNYFNSIPKKEYDEFYIGFLLSEAFCNVDLDVSEELLLGMESLFYKYFSFVDQRVMSDVYRIEHDISENKYKNKNEKKENQMNNETKYLELEGFGKCLLISKNDSEEADDLFDILVFVFETNKFAVLHCFNPETLGWEAEAEFNHNEWKELLDYSDEYFNIFDKDATMITAHRSNLKEKMENFFALDNFDKKSRVDIGIHPFLFVRVTNEKDNEIFMNQLVVDDYDELQELIVELTNKLKKIKIEN